MKLIRSTKCSLKALTAHKKQTLQIILEEYARVVNFYIDYFWEEPTITDNKQLLKPIVDKVDSWFTFRLRKVACREALAMVKSARSNEWEKPIHHGKRMSLSSTIASLELSKTETFDAWIILTSIGNKLKLKLPINFHKHYHRLAELGQRLESYVIHTNYVQLCFGWDSGPKKETGDLVGVDTGIKTLATFSNGQKFGDKIESIIQSIQRCKFKSKHQKRLRRSLKQYIDEIVKSLPWSQLRLVVVEKLQNISKNTKKKYRKSFRKLLSNWNYRYWLQRLQYATEVNRVSFRSVSPYQTSIRCSSCGHTEKANRVTQGTFCCKACGHVADADINAAQNILTRFSLGPYGAQFKPCNV